MIWQNLINWGELSRLLSGSRMTIRRNKIPIIHKEKINELQMLIDDWVKSLPSQTKTS
jgi:hypothetical protein